VPLYSPVDDHHASWIAAHPTRYGFRFSNMQMARGARYEVIRAVRPRVEGKLPSLRASRFNDVIRLNDKDHHLGRDRAPPAGQRQPSAIRLKVAPLCTPHGRKPGPGPAPRTHRTMSLSEKLFGLCLCRLMRRSSEWEVLHSHPPSSAGILHGRCRRGRPSKWYSERSRCGTGGTSTRISPTCASTLKLFIGPPSIRRAGLLVPREQMMGDHGPQILFLECRHGVESSLMRLSKLRPRSSPRKVGEFRKGVCPLRGPGIHVARERAQTSPRRPGRTGETPGQRDGARHPPPDNAAPRRGAGGDRTDFYPPARSTFSLVSEQASSSSWAGTSAQSALPQRMFLPSSSRNLLPG
jgi:hypothetical protein